MRHGVLGVVVVILAGLAVDGPASAATNSIYVGVVPEFPTRVEVGATNVPASIQVINSSAGAEVTGSLTVTELTLIPSCGNFTANCVGGADPGVFELSSKGTGVPGTNCADKSFDITVVDRTTGRVRFTTSDRSPILLDPADISDELDTCRIRFTLSGLREPGIDSYPSIGETQTNQIGFVSVRHGDGNTGSDQGEDITTVFSDAKLGRWVDRSFRDLLDRPANIHETSYWVSAITSGQETRPGLAKKITESLEYRTLVVNKYFTTYLDRKATAEELTTYADLIAHGWSFQWAESYVLASDEFFARQGSTYTGYAESLFRLILHTAPDPSGVAWLVDQMTRGAPRFSVAVHFTTYGPVHDRLAAQAAPWLLRRAATRAEVEDWSGQLDDGFRLEYLYANLVGSEEYWSEI